MTHKLKGVRVEEHAYRVNKFSENVGLETWMWRQIVTSQTAHTKCKWPPYAIEWNAPMKIFCVRHCVSQGRTQEGLGLNPVEIDILRKL